MIKQDADSKDGKTRGEATLDGAIFKLYEDSKCTQRAEVTDASGKTTNGIYVVKNGQFDTDYMICGKDYWLKEEKAPKDCPNGVSASPCSLSYALIHVGRKSATTACSEL